MTRDGEDEIKAANGPMLHVVTMHGTLRLGDAPATHVACEFCGRPAQILADDPQHVSSVAACAPCAVAALVIASIMGMTDVVE